MKKQLSFRKKNFKVSLGTVKRSVCFRMGNNNALYWDTFQKSVRDSDLQERPLTSLPICKIIPSRWIIYPIFYIVIAFNSRESKRITIKHYKIELKWLSHTNIITITVIRDAVHILWVSFDLRSSDWHSDNDRKVGVKWLSNKKKAVIKLKKKYKFRKISIMSSVIKNRLKGGEIRLMVKEVMKCKLTSI